MSDYTDLISAVVERFGMGQYGSSGKLWYVDVFCISSYIIVVEFVGCVVHLNHDDKVTKIDLSDPDGLQCLDNYFNMFDINGPVKVMGGTIKITL